MTRRLVARARCSLDQTLSLLALVLTIAAGNMALAPVRPASAQERPLLSAADYGTIQDALDSLPAAGGTVFVPAGAYTLAHKLRLRSHVELRGAGMDQTVLTLADGANDHGISNANLVQGNTDITIRDLGLRGNAANQSDWSFGVRLVNVTDSLVLHVEADDFSKDGFYLGYNAQNGVRNVRVSGCKAVANRRYGLAIKHGTENVVEGCVFEGNGFADEGSAVKLGPDQGLADWRNRIIGNRASGNYAGFVLLAAVGYDSRVADNLVCRNEALGNQVVGFQDFRGTDNLFFDNWADGNGQDYDMSASTRTQADSADACDLPPLPNSALR